VLKLELHLSLVQAFCKSVQIQVSGSADWTRFANEGLLLPLCSFAGVLFLTASLACLYAALKKRKKLLELQNRQYEQLIEYTGIIENLYEDIRNQKHDFLNILFSIKGYVESGQWEEFSSLYRSILDEYGETTPENVLFSLNRIQHPGLKGILGYKLNRAVSLGINVHLNIFTSIEFRDVDPLVLCKIIGVLADNAVEAACDSPEKEIHIAMESDIAHASVIISNTYKEKPDLIQLDKRGYSTKGAKRGVGLYNVKQILLHNPSMTLKTSLENGLFFQELIITK
jgi:two-component system sensor histidine kinase AgrC